jgi:hypothetical protein
LSNATRAQAEEIFKVLCPDDEFLPLHVNADEDVKGSAVRVPVPASIIDLGPCYLHLPVLVAVFRSLIRV